MLQTEQKPTRRLKNHSLPKSASVRKPLAMGIRPKSMNGSIGVLQTRQAVVM